MGNPHRGEVSFDVAGKSYTLHYSTDAICALEEESDRGFIDISSEMLSWNPPLDGGGKAKEETEEQARVRVSRIRVSLVRMVFWAGLRDHHPMSVKAAGELMADAGGLAAVLPLVWQGFERAFPAPESKDARPPVKGQSESTNGIGLGS